MNVVFLDAGTHLLARCAGVWEPVEVAEILKAIGARASQAGHIRLMIDWSDVGPPRHDAFRRLAGEDVARLLSPPLRVGVLYRRMATNGTAESVARQLGAQLRVGHDEADLLIWLLAEEPCA